MSTPAKLTSTAEIHEHWRCTGAAWRVKCVPDARPSPGGTLIVYRRYDGSRSPWCVANFDALSFGHAFDQPGVKRALALAERIEQLRMADGNPFDWNSAEARRGIHHPPGIHTLDGRPLTRALGELLDAFNAAHGGPRE